MMQGKMEGWRGGGNMDVRQGKYRLFTAVTATSLHPLVPSASRRFLHGASQPVAPLATMPRMSAAKSIAKGKGKAKAKAVTTPRPKPLVRPSLSSSSTQCDTAATTSVGTSTEIGNQNPEQSEVMATLSDMRLTLCLHSEWISSMGAINLESQSEMRDMAKSLKEFTELFKLYS